MTWNWNRARCTDEKQYDVSMEDDERLCISSNVNAALVSLDETPVKTGKLPISSKVTKGKQKLQSATKTLKRKLELSYEFPFGSSSDEEIDLKDLKTLSVCNAGIERKMSKFSVLCWTCADINFITISHTTMEEFGATNYLVKKSCAIKNPRKVC